MSYWIGVLRRLRIARRTAIAHGARAEFPGMAVFLGWMAHTVVSLILLASAAGWRFSPLTYSRAHSGRSFGAFWTRAPDARDDDCNRDS
jgi:hypothetical protein